MSDTSEILHDVLKCLEDLRRELDAENTDRTDRSEWVVGNERVLRLVTLEDTLETVWRATMLMGDRHGE